MSYGIYLEPLSNVLILIEFQSYCDYQIINTVKVSHKHDNLFWIINILLIRHQIHQKKIKFLPKKK